MREQVTALYCNLQPCQGDNGGGSGGGGGFGGGSASHSYQVAPLPSTLYARLASAAVLWQALAEHGCGGGISLSAGKAHELIVLLADALAWRSNGSALANLSTLPR